MPVILIQVDAQDNATAGIQRAATSLGTLDRAMSSLASASARVESAQGQLESRMTRAAVATQQAERAAMAYAKAQAAIATGTDTSVSALNRADTAFARMISTAERSAVANQNVASSYRTLASAAEQAAAAEARANGGGGSGGRGGSGGGGHGGSFTNSIAGQFLVYQMGFQIASDAVQGLKQGFANNLALSQTLAMTQATTGVSTGTINSLRQYSLGTAGSGQSQYDSNTIAQGAYAVLSAGIKDPNAMKAVTEASRMAATESGSPDLAPFSSALIHAMSSYGVSQGQMTKQAMPFMDQIMMAVNQGIVQPTEVPGAVGVFGGTAAMAGVKFPDVMGLFAQNTLISRSADQSALNTDVLLRSVTGATPKARQVAHYLHADDLLGADAFKHQSLGQWFTRLNQVTQGPNQQALLKGMLSNADAVAEAEGFIGPGGSNMSKSMGFLASAGGAGGGTKKGYDQYQQSDAAKFADAQVAFKTSVQEFAKAATPLATAMLKYALYIPGLSNPKPDKHGESDPEKSLANTLGASHYPGFMQWIGHQEDRLANVLNGNGDPDSGHGSKTIAQHAATAAQSTAHQVSAFYASRNASFERFAANRYAGAERFAARDDPGTGANPDDQARAMRGITSLSGKRNNIGVSDAEARLTLAMQGGNAATIASALGIALQAIKESTLSGVSQTLERNRLTALVDGGKAGPAAAAFAKNQLGLGALVAGNESTAVRFGKGSEDPLVAENRRLREEVRQDNDKIIALLRKIAEQGGGGHPAHNQLLHVGGDRRGTGR